MNALAGLIRWRFGFERKPGNAVLTHYIFLRPGHFARVLLLLAGFISSITSETLVAQSRFASPDSRERSTTLGIASSWQNASSWAGGFDTTQQQDWKLGVTADNTETGVVIRQVTPGSSASRARLEVRDVIIAVGGYQVGLIDGGLFDLGEELRRRADSQGNVTLLVRDHRNGLLASVRVPLDGNQTTLRGELLYRERMAMPNDAVVNVVLENLTRPFYTVRNGQVALRASNQSVIPFEIPYDPSYIQPQDKYQVRATVTSAGRTILETRQPALVLTQGNPSQVQMALSPVTQTQPLPTSSSLAATTYSPVTTAGYPNMNFVQDQVVQLYRQYLGRDPSLFEIAAWGMTPASSSRLSHAPIEIMGLQEYYDKVGNNDRDWFTQVFRNILGRAPSAQELDLWMRRFADLRFSRTDLLQQLNSQVRR